jgi:hypothetical protein
VKIDFNLLLMTPCKKTCFGNITELTWPQRRGLTPRPPLLYGEGEERGEPWVTWVGCRRFCSPCPYRRGAGLRLLLPRARHPTISPAGSAAQARARGVAVIPSSPEESSGYAVPAQSGGVRGCRGADGGAASPQGPPAVGCRGRGGPAGVQGPRPCRTPLRTRRTPAVPPRGRAEPRGDRAQPHPLRAPFPLETLPHPGERDGVSWRTPGSSRWGSDMVARLLGGTRRGGWQAVGEAGGDRKDGPWASPGAK